MPPKSKKRHQSIEAAAKAREILKQAHLGKDESISETGTHRCDWKCSCFRKPY